MNYNWKRFWCQPTDRFEFDHRGYLYDPDSSMGSIYNPEIVPFAKIADTKCLALLGEPGIGKSTTLETEYNILNAQIKTEGNDTVLLDLRAYGSEDRLIDNIFNNPKFISWIKGTHNLHIFLDSLDECLLKISNISSILLSELRNYPIERLNLCIACRTADWPLYLKNGLIAIWGEENFKSYELLPLRRIDVSEAAKTEGFDPDEFLNLIESLDVVPLAIKPVTLEFLINIYRKEGKFPSKKVDLYHQGCRILCEEPNQARRDIKLTGNLTPDMRLIIAARIAAVTMFSNRFAIWTGLDRGDVPVEDVKISELTGGSENIQGNKLEISDSEIQEAISTGLFTSRGDNHMGWSHQTYAEFLAGWYLFKHEMTTDQIMNLLIHPIDPHKKLIPQLHETAAWIASFSPNIFREIINIDPEVLLRSDVTTLAEDERKILVNILLKHYDEGKLLDVNWGIRKEFKKLYYTGLDDDLKPYMSKKEKGLVVRRVAINISQACELKSLAKGLLDIALDSTDDYHIRTHAAAAVSTLGDNEVTLQLKPLVFKNVVDDIFDDLKGYALIALWPNQISIAELFSGLTPRKRPEYSGSYFSFMVSHCAQKLNPDDLPFALEYIHRNLNEFTTHYIYIYREIMLKAVEYLENTSILDEFTKIVFMRLKNHHDIFDNAYDEEIRNTFLNNAKKRHLLIERLIHLFSEYEHLHSITILSQTPLLDEKDFYWMLEHALAPQSDIQINKQWAKLIRETINWKNPHHLDLLLLACQKSEIIENEFSKEFKPIELESPEAQELIDYYKKEQEIVSKGRNKPLSIAASPEFISKRLEQFENGNLDSWWILNDEMIHDAYNKGQNSNFDSDLTKLPLWEIIEQPLKLRILDTAKEYILKYIPAINLWLSDNRYYHPSLSGYRAIRLIYQQDVQSLSNYNKEIWKKWAHSILAFPSFNEADEDQNIQKQIVEQIYRQAPDEIILALLGLIDKENKNDSFHSINKLLGLIYKCLDEKLTKRLLEKMKEPTMNPTCMGSIMSFLLESNVNEVKDYAQSILNDYLLRGNGKDKAIVSASYLLTFGDTSTWPLVLSTIQTDPEFGKELFNYLTTYRSDSENLITKLNEENLADLFLWLVNIYPYGGDSEYFSGHISHLEYLRDSILRFLKDKGTIEACNELKRIEKELPTLNWIKWIVYEAQQIMRQRTWVPPKPEEILKVASNNKLRLIQNGSQLLDVIIESLIRLEHKLQGETPAAIDLWDEKSKNKYQPKDENSFSDYVKRHFNDDLKEKGIISNREVQIRRGRGSSGENTDIHIDAVIKDSNDIAFDVITVIIECKGSWNKDLYTAMNNQLVQRYMKDNTCNDGLYLVGWYNCKQWDDEDYKKHISINLCGDKEKTKDSLEKQAADLSDEITHIKSFVINCGLR